MIEFVVIFAAQYIAVACVAPIKSDYHPIVSVIYLNSP